MRHKRPCAECGTLVEVEEKPRGATYNLVFCGAECSKNFWKRNAQYRKERGLPPLRELKR